MIKVKNCVCCKRFKVGKSGVMCGNCWNWVTTKMAIEDIALVVAGIYHREPNNKHAREISQYLVADNYMYGKAHLPKCKMCKDPDKMQYDYMYCPYCMRKLKNELP